MRPLEVFPSRWLEWEPPSTCHEPISALFATLGASAATAGTATAGFDLLTGAAVAGGAAESGLSLGTLGTAASILGTGVSAISGMNQSDYQAAVARREAEALKQKANEDAAAAQRVQISRERQTALALSRNQAVAAASGGGATDPTVLNIQSDIAGQGEYNALSALYEGQSRARSDTYQADIDLFKARRIQAGAPLAAGGTILGGISSFADRRLRRNYLLNQYGDY